MESNYIRNNRDVTTNNINNDNVVKITNLDLYSNQYDEQILVHNMCKLSPHSILTTQSNLSNNFIWNYVLNKKYHIFREDRDITLQEVLNYYPDFAKFNPH
jgi:hypothetical protein